MMRSSCQSWDVEAVLALIDARCRDDALDESEQDGLLDFQKQTLQRLWMTLSQHRAALLVAPTGSGKTFVAAALARMVGRRLGLRSVLVVPARLRSMWAGVMERMHAPYDALLSHEQLSRNDVPTPHCAAKTLWLVDEAHAFRRASTLRYQALGRATLGGYVCLCSATPLCTHPQDLQSLLDLLGQAELSVVAAHAVFETLAVSGSEPLRFDGLIRRRLLVDELGGEWMELLEACVALRWSVSAWSGRSAGSATTERNASALMGELLLSRLASHPIAFVDTLERLRRIQQLSRRPSGHLMTRLELARLLGATPLEQGWLGFAWDESVVSSLPSSADTGGPQTQPPNARVPSEAEHSPTQQLPALLRRAKRLLAKTLQVDEKLRMVEEHLRETLGEPCFGWHRAREKAVLFTQYEDTARYLARALSLRWSVGLLTGSTAKVGSLRASPEQLLAAFSADGRCLAPQLLVCTDLLSTGHNLQAASVLIHFDEPWNPVLLSQREGRLLRLGQSAEVVWLSTCRSMASSAALGRWQQRKQGVLELRRCLARALEAPLTCTPRPASRLLVAERSARFWLFDVPYQHHLLSAQQAKELVGRGLVKSVQAAPLPVQMSRFARTTIRRIAMALRDCRYHPEAQGWWQRISSLRRVLCRHHGRFVDLVLASATTDVSQAVMGMARVADGRDTDDACAATPKRATLQHGSLDGDIETWLLAAAPQDRLRWASGMLQRLENGLAPLVHGDGEPERCIMVQLGDPQRLSSLNDDGLEEG